MCSRGNPEECFKATDSLLSKSRKTDLAIILDNDDEALNIYKGNLRFSYRYLFSDQNSLTEKINNVALNNIDKYEYFHLTNDDVLYQTDFWDEIFMDTLKMKGPGIVYGNDLFQGQGLCTFPFVSKEIIKALGWLQMPLLNKFFGDTVWMNIGKNSNCLHYHPAVIIEHLHFLNNKRKNPNEEEMTKYIETYNHDRHQFMKWLVNSEKDIQKVRDICLTLK